MNVKGFLGFFNLIPVVSRKATFGVVAKGYRVGLAPGSCGGGSKGVGWGEEVGWGGAGGQGKDTGTEEGRGRRGGKWPRGKDMGPRAGGGRGARPGEGMAGGGGCPHCCHPRHKPRIRESSETGEAEPVG